MAVCVGETVVNVSSHSYFRIILFNDQDTHTHRSVAVCVGETVVNVSSMPRKRSGAKTYSSLQSDMQTPWWAPGGGAVALRALVVLLSLA